MYDTSMSYCVTMAHWDTCRVTGVGTRGTPSPTFFRKGTRPHRSRGSSDGKIIVFF